MVLKAIGKDLLYEILSFMEYKEGGLDDYIKRAESCALEAADCKVIMVVQGQGGKRGAKRQKLGYFCYCETMSDG